MSWTEIMKGDKLPRLIKRENETITEMINKEKQDELINEYEGFKEMD